MHAIARWNVLRQSLLFRAGDSPPPGCWDKDLGAAELVLGMHRRGQTGRPPIDRVVGRLQYEWERRTDRRW